MRTDLEKVRVFRDPSPGFANRIINRSMPDLIRDFQSVKIKPMASPTSLEF